MPRTKPSTKPSTTPPLYRIFAGQACMESDATDPRTHKPLSTRGPWLLNVDETGPNLSDLLWSICQDRFQIAGDRYIHLGIVRRGIVTSLGTSQVCDELGRWMDDEREKAVQDAGRAWLCSYDFEVERIDANGQRRMTLAEVVRELEAGGWDYDYHEE